ncbi:MAG: tRNA (adenosine(37)-N6)-threonylcarbamoyltransferase complex ATPase subunit type 1 TsaE [Minisyncoccia bacterium]
MKTLKSFSLNETKKIAAQLAKKLTKKQSKQALVIALIGELGAGKTTFVSGFLNGLKIKSLSPSPTFILIRRKKIKHPYFKNLYHIDAYRLKNPKELINLKIKDLILNPQNILLIEWANKILRFLPKNTIKIYFYHGRLENERKIVLKNISL